MCLLYSILYKAHLASCGRADRRGHSSRSQAPARERYGLEALLYLHRGGVQGLYWRDMSLCDLLAPTLGGRRWFVSRPHGCLDHAMDNEAADPPVQCVPRPEPGNEKRRGAPAFIAIRQRMGCLGGTVHFDPGWPSPLVYHHGERYCILAKWDLVLSSGLAFRIEECIASRFIRSCSPNNFFPASSVNHFPVRRMYMTSKT